jgi:hypothetical protein
MEVKSAIFGVQLLPCHGDADSILRRDEVIRALGRVGDGELHPLTVPLKHCRVSRRPGTWGVPLSSLTSQPSSAEKTTACVIGMAPSSTFSLSVSHHSTQGPKPFKPPTDAFRGAARRPRGGHRPPCAGCGLVSISGEVFVAGIELSFFGGNAEPSGISFLLFADFRRRPLGVKVGGAAND